MGRWCWAPGCKERQSKDKENPGISFHVFPKDLSLKEQWIRATKRTATPGKHAALCSKHFSDDCFKIRTKWKILKEGSVPTIFHPQSNLLISEENTAQRSIKDSSLSSHTVEIDSDNQKIDTIPRFGGERIVCSCSAINCTEKFVKGGPSFHAFPSDPNDRELWRLATTRDKIPEYAFLCAKHFTKDSFDTLGLGGTRILKKGAVPSIFQFSKEIKKGTVHSSGSELMQSIKFEEIESESFYMNSSTRDASTSPLSSFKEEHPVKMKPVNICTDFGLVVEGSQYVVVREPRDDDALDVLPMQHITATLIKSNTSDHSSGCSQLQAVPCSCTLGSRDIKPTYTKLRAIACPCTFSHGSTNSCESDLIIEQDDSDMAEIVEDDEMEELSDEEPSTARTVPSSTLKVQTVTNSCTDTAVKAAKNSEKPRRRFWNPRYVGDFKVEDLDNPGKAQRFWTVATKESMVQRKKIKTLQQKNRRLDVHIQNLDAIVKQLKQHIKRMQKHENKESRDI